MIDKITRNSNYFRNKLASNDKTIYASDFDLEFNNIAEYLKLKIKPAVDSLTNEAVKGVAGRAGAYFHNVGDGSTDWQYISDDKLDDYSIGFRKLLTSTTSGVLSTNNNGELGVKLTPTSNGQSLVSRADGALEWRKLQQDDIADNTLTGSQLGVLSMENFIDNQFITNIVPNVIMNTNIRDLNITNNKIQDGVIGVEKLGVFNNLPVILNGLTVNHIDDGAIDSTKIKSNTIPVSLPRNTPQMGNWAKEFGDSEAQADSSVFKKIIKSEYILDDSIVDTDLEPIINKPLDRATGIKASKAFLPDVPLAFQFSSNHIAEDSIENRMFNGNVIAAINRIWNL